MTTKNITLSEALANAQAKMQNAAFDSKSNFSKNGKNNYASLASVRDAAVPALTAHGISVSQGVVRIDDDLFMRTTLRKGAEIIEEIVPMIVGKNDMHGVGSAMTYARRYGLGAICGIASDEDDDGDLAVANAPKDQPPTKITAAQAGQIEAEIQRTKADLMKFMDHFGIDDLGDLPAALFKKAMQMLAERERKMLEQAMADAADSAEAAE